MNPLSEHASELANLREELGADCPSIFYGGKLIKVLAGGARNANSNTLGGASLDADFSGTFTADQFPIEPKADELFRYPSETGKRYKIDAVIFAPGRKQLRITAIDAAQSL